MGTLPCSYPFPAAPQQQARLAAPYPAKGTLSWEAACWAEATLPARRSPSGRRLLRSPAATSFRPEESYKRLDSTSACFSTKPAGSCELATRSEGYMFGAMAFCNLHQGYLPFDCSRVAPRPPSMYTASVVAEYQVTSRPAVAVDEPGELRSTHFLAPD